MKVGDKVLLLQKRTHKLAQRYDPRPFIVVDRIGATVVLRREALLRRNVAHMRIYYEMDNDEDYNIHADIPDDQQEEHINEPRGRPVRNRWTPAYLND